MVSQACASSSTVNAIAKKYNNLYGKPRHICQILTLSLSVASLSLNIIQWIFECMKKFVICAGVLAKARKLSHESIFFCCV